MSVVDIGPGKDWLLQGPSLDRPAVELWTVRRLPFTTEQDESQKEMVRKVGLRLAALRGRGDHQCLSGVFASDRIAGRQPDAENIVFYNFGLPLFYSASKCVSFERSYRSAPNLPRPLDQSAPFYHSWSFLPENAAMSSWALLESQPVAAWEGVPLEPATGDLGLRAWLALRQNAGQVVVRKELAASDAYVVRITWRLPDLLTMRVVSLTKGLIDGCLAALQRADELRPEVIERLLRRSWGTKLTRETLLSLVSADRPGVLLLRCPFNLNGLDPCDENCVAGRVRVTTAQHRAGSLDGEVWRVRPATPCQDL